MFIRPAVASVVNSYTCNQTGQVQLVSVGPAVNATRTWEMAGNGNVLMSHVCLQGRYFIGVCKRVSTGWWLLQLITVNI